MGKIFYISDLHFGHERVITYENRPFSDIHDMEEKLIYNWNKKVSDDDIVYVCGDFAVKGKEMTLDKILEIYNKLKGHKVLIIGNHDLNYIDKISDKLEFIPVDYLEIKDNSVKNNQIVILCHYPIEEWDGKHYGSIHIHGHIHSRDIIQHLPNRYNCGVDVNNFEPVTLEELQANVNIFGGRKNDLV